MWTNNFLYLAFLMQVIFISWYMPKTLIKQSKNILQRYPQKQYPKLYPVSRDAIEIGINLFKQFNRAILILGFYIISYGAYTQSKEMLNVDSSAVLIGFFLLQYVPYFIMEFSGFKFIKLMQLASKQSIRKADLQPRRFLDYLSPLYLTLFITSNLVFIGVVEYFVRNPFDGFGGYYNLLTMIFIDVFLGSIILWNIHSKTKDPHLSVEDRTTQIKKLMKIMVLTIVMVTAFAASELIMSATGTRQFFDSLLSFYFLTLAFIGLDAYRIENINFEVYRES